MRSVAVFSTQRFPGARQVEERSYISLKSILTKNRFHHLISERFRERTKSVVLQNNSAIEVCKRFITLRLCAAAAGIGFQLQVWWWSRGWWPVVSCQAADENQLMDGLQPLFHTPSQLRALTFPVWNLYQGWTCTQADKLPESGADVFL